MPAHHAGTLERSELKLLAASMGVTLNRVELDAAMAEMDEDGSGGTTSVT